MPEFPANAYDLTPFQRLDTPEQMALIEVVERILTAIWLQRITAAATVAQKRQQIIRQN